MGQNHGWSLKYGVGVADMSVCSSVVWGFGDWDGHVSCWVPKNEGRLDKRMSVCVLASVLLVMDGGF